MKTLSIKAQKSRPELNQLFDQRVEKVMEAVDLYHRHLLSYIRSRGNAGEPDDILQDLWQYVLLHFKEKDILNLKLLRRKALHLYIDQYRKRRRRAAYFESLDVTYVNGEHPATARPSGNEEAYTDDEIARLKERFWENYPNIKLTSKQKDIVWAYGRDGMTFQEIESQFGVPTSTASDWIRVAREQFKQELGE